MSRNSCPQRCTPCFRQGSFPRWRSHDPRREENAMPVVESESVRSVMHRELEFRVSASDCPWRKTPSRLGASPGPCGIFGVVNRGRCCLAEATNNLGAAAVDSVRFQSNATIGRVHKIPGEPASPALKAARLARPSRSARAATQATARQLVLP